MPMSDEQVRFGAWTSEELATTAQQGNSAGADEGLSHPLRFTSNVAKLLRRRKAFAADYPDAASPAIFLLLPTPPDAIRDSTQHVPMLDSGKERVAGRLWFVAAVVRSGRYVEHTAKSDAELFAKVTDDLSLGEVPAIVFDPTLPVPESRFYRNGLNDPDTYDLIPSGNQEITLQGILDVIDTVHAASLLTPEARTRAIPLWNDARRHYPSDDAEAIIQAVLRPGLKVKFPTCNIRLEQLLDEGRLDVEVEEPDALDPSIVVKHAILELKVLRSFSKNGTTITDAYTKGWIKSGVEQAAVYRDGKRARGAALCCFDMRRRNDPTNSCFGHVLEMAATLQVHLRRWYIYASSRQLRRELAARNLAARI